MRNLYIPAVLLIVVAFMYACSTPQQKAEKLCQKAYEKYWGVDWDKVIELSTEAMMLNPDGPWAYSQRGYAYAEKEKYGQALDDLTMALVLDNTYSIAYFTRGAIYSDLGRYEKAIEDYSRVIELDSFALPAYNNRARALMELEEYDDAEKDLKKALEIDPSFTFAMVTMAEIQADYWFKLEKSCRWLRKAIENGYTEFFYIKTSKALDNIRDTDCYKRVMKMATGSRQ